MTTAYPLQWPPGWPRTASYQRKRAQFGTTRANMSGTKARLNIADATERVHAELAALGVNARDDAIVSTNLKLNMSGIPRGDQGEPSDPGVALYWQPKKGPMKVMAIDQYNRVADNIAAIAATLNHMRGIERHGSAVVLERAFEGFAALPPPRSCYDVLGLSPDASEAAIEAQFRRKARDAHPDAGGSDNRMAELNAARDQALAQLRR